MICRPTKWNQKLLLYFEAFDVIELCSKTKFETRFHFDSQIERKSDSSLWVCVKHELLWIDYDYIKWWMIKLLCARLSHHTTLCWVNQSNFDLKCGCSFIFTFILFLFRRSSQWVDSLCCKKIDGKECVLGGSLKYIVDFISSKQNEPKCPKVFCKWHYLCLQNKVLDARIHIFFLVSECLYDLVRAYVCMYLLCDCIVHWVWRLLLPPRFVLVCAPCLSKIYNFSTQHLTWIEISSKLLNFFSPLFWFVYSWLCALDIFVYFGMFVNDGVYSFTIEPLAIVVTLYYLSKAQCARAHENHFGFPISEYCTDLLQLCGVCVCPFLHVLWMNMRYKTNEYSTLLLCGRVHVWCRYFLLYSSMCHHFVAQFLFGCKANARGKSLSKYAIPLKRCKLSDTAKNHVFP